MARLREHKKVLRQWLESEQWQEHIQDIAAMPPREAAGPLLSFLLLGGDMTHRAAVGLGHCVHALCNERTEDARNIMRRLMWHMNEESGNIGWGIPEAFAEILVQDAKMAKEFHSIILSYVIDTGRDDNYCDHAILRRSCFWAVGRLVQARPELCTRVIPWLVRGFQDEDVACRGMAVWALGQFPSQDVPGLEVFPALRRLKESPVEELLTPCAVFDGTAVQTLTVGEILERAQF